MSPLGGGGWWWCKKRRSKEKAAFSSSSQLDIWIIFPPFLVSALPSKQNSSGHSRRVENQWKPAELRGETGEARLGGGGGGGAGGWSLRAGGFPEEVRREPGKGRSGRAADSLCRGLANLVGCRREAAGGQTGGQRQGGPPCPVEERRALRSPFARRITSCPGTEESAWAEGRAQRGTAGRETHQGQGEEGKRGRLEGEKAQQACQKPAIQVGLGTSCLPPSLPPLPVPAACQQAGRAGGQEVLACIPMVAKGQGKGNTFLLLAASCQFSMQGAGKCSSTTSPFPSPPHLIPGVMQTLVPCKDLRGCNAVQGTWRGVGWGVHPSD